VPLNLVLYFINISSNSQDYQHFTSRIFHINRSKAWGLTSSLQQRVSWRGLGISIAVYKKNKWNLCHSYYILKGLSYFAHHQHMIHLTTKRARSYTVVNLIQSSKRESFPIAYTRLHYTSTEKNR
jgi:hypothetical protein